MDQADLRTFEGLEICRTKPTQKPLYCHAVFTIIFLAFYFVSHFVFKLNKMFRLASYKMLLDLHFLLSDFYILIFIF